MSAGRSLVTLACILPMHWEHRFYEELVTIIWRLVIGNLKQYMYQRYRGCSIIDRRCKMPKLNTVECIPNEHLPGIQQLIYKKSRFLMEL